ncbi:Zinc finger protein 519-like 3 [Homarus americanus]|uniref:Zinc finger protein 519-like 3 n=1 Tax=Homarus americanus TaxID=6706 RepID=A0A8J5NDA4_HOMAM|nr:Zinc finger protein 519-like 3 [Homarus americanus]
MHTCMAEHTDEKDIKCEEFDESFNSDYDVTQHVTVDEKDIKCEEFDESFNSDYDVTQQAETLKRSLTSEESGEDEDKEESRIIPAKDLKELFSSWNKVGKIVEDYHPDVAAVEKGLSIFNDTVMSYFWKYSRRATSTQAGRQYSGGATVLQAETTVLQAETTVLQAGDSTPGRRQYSGGTTVLQTGRQYSRRATVLRQGDYSRRGDNYSRRGDNYSRRATVLQAGHSSPDGDST